MLNEWVVVWVSEENSAGLSVTVELLFSGASVDNTVIAEGCVSACGTRGYSDDGIGVNGYSIMLVSFVLPVNMFALLCSKIS